MTTDSTRTMIGSGVPSEFAEDVRQAAEAEDRSVGYLIRRALRHELARVRTAHGQEPETDKPRAAR